MGAWPSATVQDIDLFFYDDPEVVLFLYLMSFWRSGSAQDISSVWECSGFQIDATFFLWIDFQKFGCFEKEKPSPFILHHKLVCFIDGNTREHRHGPPKQNKFLS